MSDADGSPVAASCPDVRISDVNACALPSWYPSFEDVTIRSVILPLSASVVSYLRSGSTLLLPTPPDLSRLLPCDPRRTQAAPSASTESSKEDEEPPCFPELEEGIERALGEFEEVFPRLSWTAPQVRHFHSDKLCFSNRFPSFVPEKDAVWAMGSLKCRSVGEVFLLLKASDLVSYDLCHPYDECIDFDGGVVPSASLVLRRWSNLHPAQEFRAFVVSGKLVGTSCSCMILTFC